MILYYKPGACSLASHIMLYEVGANFEIELVDTGLGKTQSGRNYLEINANGYVPTLRVEDGVNLSEGVAILQYIADTHPDQAFSPQLGSIERAHLHQFLNFAAAELHKAWTPLFMENSSEDEKEIAIRKVSSKFDYLESILNDGRKFLVENRFSVADAYTFVLVNWANYQSVDLTKWPNLASYIDHIAARPSTQAAMKAEGLIQ